MQYQIMYSRADGWQTVHPDGYGIHARPHRGRAKCIGCWRPDTDDAEPWFTALESEGQAIAARCGYTLDNVRVFKAKEYFDFYSEHLLQEIQDANRDSIFAVLENCGGDDVLLARDCNVEEALALFRAHPTDDRCTTFALLEDQLDLYMDTCTVVEE